MSITANQTLNHLVRYQKIYLTLLLLVILLSPYFPRYFSHNSLIIGAPSYFHLNEAEKISQPNFYQNPYHLLLSLNFVNNSFVYQSVPLVLALLSLFLIFNLAKALNLNPQNLFLFLLFLIISPVFVYTFTVLNHHSFFVFLVLLGFTLLSQEKRFIAYLSFPVFIVIPFFDLFSSVLVLSLLVVYLYNRSASFKKNKETRLLIIVLLALLPSAFFLKRYLAQVPFRQLLLLGPYHPQSLFLDFFSDFGGLFGLSLFALLLAAVGLVAWKKKKTHLIYLVFLLALFFCQTSALIYLNFLVAFFASLGFTHLLNRKWKLDIIKNASLFLILLGLLFSTLTYLNSLSSLPPSPEIENSLLWLRENVPPDQTIFSRPRDSYLIEYFAQRPAFLRFHDPGFKAKAHLTSQIFQSSYIRETFPLLEKNSLFYFYLSPRTKADLPTDQGLIFLFQNERFKKIYSQDNIEVWKFT